MKRVEFSRDTMKLLLFIISFIVVLYSIFAFVVMEDVDRVQELENKYKLQKTIASYVQQNNSDLQKSMDDVQEIKAFMDKSIDEQKLYALLSKFLQNITIKKVDEKSDKVAKIKYYIEATLPSMKNFYDLVETIEQQKYPLEISYPITFKRENHSIALTLFLTLYQAKPRQ